MDCNRNQNLATLFLILAFCVWCHCTTAQGVTLTASYVDVACPATEITFTCSISGGVMRWRVTSTSRPVESTFIGDQPTRQLTSDGVVFTTSVTSPPPNFVSTLSTTATTSLEGVRVRCTDGDNGITMETTLHIATSPSMPLLNLRIVATQNGTASSTVTLQWDPPSGGDDVDNYTLTVTPGGSSSVDVHTVTMATIELSYNTEYTVRVSATNCAGRGPEAVLGPFTLVNCSSPSAANGVIIEPYSSTTEGSVIHYQCDESFVSNTRVEAVCRNNGSWSPDPRQHVCRLADCGAPKLPNNSMLITSTGTSIGQEVTFQCTIGPVPRPIITSVCTSVSDSSSEGVWSPDPQQVVCGVTCSPPNQPTNGFLSDVTQNIVTFGCNEGYSPQGTLTAVCVATDTWSPDPAQLECTSNVTSPSTYDTTTVTAIITNGTSGEQVITAAVSSAVVCSVVFYILGAVSTILIYLAVTRCRKTLSPRQTRPQSTGPGPVYDEVVPVSHTEQVGIELKENVAYATS